MGLPVVVDFDDLVKNAGRMLGGLGVRDAVEVRGGGVE